MDQKGATSRAFVVLVSRQNGLGPDSSLMLISGPARARGQGHKALFYTTTLYSTPYLRGYLRGELLEEMMGERGREVIIDQRLTGLLYILGCDV